MNSEMRLIIQANFKIVPFMKSVNFGSFGALIKINQFNLGP